MIKALKILGWLGIASVLFTLTLLIIANSYDGPPGTIIDAIRAVVCQRLLGQPNHVITQYEFGELIGREVIPYALIYTLLLVSLQSRKRGLYIATKILFVVIAMGQLGKGSYPILMFVIAVMLFLKPVSEYFKKPVEQLGDNF